MSFLCACVSSGPWTHCIFYCLSAATIQCSKAIQEVSCKLHLANSCVKKLQSASWVAAHDGDRDLQCSVTHLPDSGSKRRVKQPQSLTKSRLHGRTVHRRLQHYFSLLFTNFDVR